MLAHSSLLRFPRGVFMWILVEGGSALLHLSVQQKRSTHVGGYKGRSFFS